MNAGEGDMSYQVLCKNQEADTVLSSGIIGKFSSTQFPIQSRWTLSGET